MLWVRSLLGLYVPRPYHHPEFAHKYRAVSIGTDEKLRLQVSSEDPSTASTDVWDPSVYGKHMKIIQSMSAMSGARSVFSFGTAGDVWFQLVHEIRWPALIALEIALETFLIVACGAALTAVALAEGKSGDAASFRGKILVSLTTVRLASDSVCRVASQ
jgi:hypothetical protein|tara:strand:- start:147 stop:623 length:477 start_codon:yes stop_codon:yes gene_type:complete